ncbi:MAG TPA: OmpA family protein [Azospirillaceae bacterium]|nr:OmpA family protein [Azospirillaceae bacterium]
MKAARFLLLGLPLLAAACASAPDSYPPLARLQDEFEQARANQVASLAPVPYRDAERSLEAAQNALGKAEERELDHLTYVAGTRLAIARAEAERNRAEEERRLMAEQRERILLQARERQIGQARTEADRARQEAMAAAIAAEEQRMRAQAAESQLAQFQARQTAQGTVLTLSNLLFDHNSASLHPGDQRRLQPLADYLRQNADRGILIEGHTDSTGADEYNLTLSRSRAAAVRDYLVNAGVDPGRVEVRGLGEDYPVADNNSDTGRQQNRRIEVTIRNPQRG